MRKHNTPPVADSESESASDSDSGSDTDETQPSDEHLMYWTGLYCNRDNANRGDMLREIQDPSRAYWIRLATNANKRRNFLDEIPFCDANRLYWRNISRIRRSVSADAILSAARHRGLTASPANAGQVQSEMEHMNRDYWMSLPVEPPSNPTPSPAPSVPIAPIAPVVVSPLEEIQDSLPSDRAVVLLLRTPPPTDEMLDWVKESLLDDQGNVVSVWTRAYNFSNFKTFSEKYDPLPHVIVPTNYLPSIPLNANQKYSFISQSMISSIHKGLELTTTNVSHVRQVVSRQLARLKVSSDKYLVILRITPDFTCLHLTIVYHAPISCIDAKVTTSNILQDLRLVKSLLVIRSSTDYLF